MNNVTMNTMDDITMNTMNNMNNVEADNTHVEITDTSNLKNNTTIDIMTDADNRTMEATMQFFKYQTEMCSTIPSLISLVNYPMNSLIIMIMVVQLRDTPGRAKSGQIHLICLAISDMSIGVFYSAGFIWLYFLPTDTQQLVQVDFLSRFRFLCHYDYLATCVNRTLMLHITVKRTQLVLNINAAEDMRARSTRDVVTHVIMSGVLPGVALYLSVMFIPDVFMEGGIFQPGLAQTILFGSSAVFFGLAAVAMTVMGTIVVIQIVAHRRLLRSQREFVVTGGRGDIEEAVTANPGTANPGTANPGTANPGMANPGMANTGMANPGTANPGTTSGGQRRTASAGMRSNSPCSQATTYMVKAETN